jgi:DNA-binding Lrp family transcriptional regulator
VFDAFVFVQTKPGHAARVTEQVRSIDGVTEAQMVTGPYDVIARVRVVDLHGLNLLISGHMKTIDGVLRVLASTVGPEQNALN